MDDQKAFNRNGKLTIMKLTYPNGEQLELYKDYKVKDNNEYNFYFLTSYFNKIDYINNDTIHIEKIGEWVRYENGGGFKSIYVICINKKTSRDTTIDFLRGLYLMMKVKHSINRLTYKDYIKIYDLNRNITECFSRL